MSASVRTIKSRRKSSRKNKGEPTLASLLKDQRKKARFILLSSGVVLVSAGLFLSYNSSDVSPTTTTASVSQSSDAISFSTEPVKIEEGLLKPAGRSQLDLKPPIRVAIPDIAIDLPVKEAKVVKGYWEVFADVAGFGLGSAYPEEQGNQVIFAHAREGLFLPLKQAKIGQQVIVFTKDKWFAYTITEIKEVNPNQIEVIAPTQDTTLTLYTCSGFSDSKRLIVTAKRTI